MPVVDPITQAMIRLADGDRRAFDTVYDAVGSRVQALCRRLVVDPVLAEDIAQEAMVKVFANADAFDPERGSATAWALGIAAWECRTSRKSTQRRREDPHERVHTDTTRTPEQDAMAAQLLDAVHEVLGTLPAQDREVLLAAWADGPRPMVSAPTFRKRLQRALTRFHTQWSTTNG